MSDWIRESNLIEGIDDPKEDARCLVVWKLLRRKRWSLTSVLWIHSRIMFVLNRRIAGKWRECNVRVGNHIPTHWHNVPGQMSAWVWNETFAHEKGWEEIKKAHVRFETIHPFEDGNGRTGRMLMNWQRVKAGLEPLCIKASERVEYYKWFTDQPPRGAGR